MEPCEAAGDGSTSLVPAIHTLAQPQLLWAFQEWTSEQDDLSLPLK